MISNKDIEGLLRADAVSQEIIQLRGEARSLTDRFFGRRVFIRGLVEVSNICLNDCLYCGIRKSNIEVVRYKLNSDEILESCRRAYEAGVRTFVLQGGENPTYAEKVLLPIVEDIRRMYGEAAITLSLGELPTELYAALREAGADRYLLRHESYNQEHYASLHPSNMSRNHRISCLLELKRLGYQVGTGIMVGSPGQTIGNILEDIDFMRSFNPEMIGIGPFIPAHSTPFSKEPAGSIEITLRLLSILRLLFPKANLPATTAVATLEGTDGRLEALRSGANVVMPNISPIKARKAYRLYNNKVASGLEAIEQIDELRKLFTDNDFELSLERGDYYDK